MAAPRGVTYTLSDYWALGPPFPGGLHFSYYPFLEGGGGSPFFPLTCLYSFQTYSFHHWGMVACNFFFVPFFFTLSFISLKSSLKRIFWPSSPTAIMGTFAVHWLKLTWACVSLVLQSVWCPVQLPPSPTCFRCGWIGHYANRLSFQLYARRGATISASCPRPQVPLIIIMFSLCWLRLLRILCVMFCLSCSSPSRSRYSIHTFKHPFVRYRSYLLLRPHPLLCP